MSDKTSPDQPAFPTLSDDEMRDSLELFATALAGMSERMDEQGKLLAKVNLRATEARSAAVGAQDQTNPKLYGELIAKTVDAKLNDVTADLIATEHNFSVEREKLAGAVKHLTDQRADLINRICAREAKVERFKARLPWLAGGIAILFVVGLLVLPRFIAAYPSGCAVLGGFWTVTTTGVPICVQDSNDGWFW